MVSTDDYTVSDAGITNVGEAKVTITLNNANYIWSNNSENAIEYTYYVVKANAGLSASINGWTYGAAANAPTASADFTLSGIYFLYAGADKVYTSTVPTLAGTYTVKAVYDGDSNILASESAPVTFTIAKANASIGGYNESYTATYNGSAYTLSGITASHAESILKYAYSKDGVAVTEIKNAGTYTVTITLPESANYNAATAVTVTVTITKIENTDTLNSYNATYLDKLSSITLPTTATGTWSWKDATLAVGNAGNNTHTAVFTPNDTTNYASREAEVTVIVAKKSVSVPTASNSVYTGNVLYSGLSGTDLYTVTDNGGTNVGSYTATLTLKDSANYAWATTTESSVSVGYQITTATNEWTSAPAITPSWTYGEAGDAGSASAKFDGVKVEYKLDGALDSTYTTTRPTNAGKYIVRFTTTNTNCTTLTATLSFEITRKQVTIPSASNSTYTGKLITSGITETAYYTVTDAGGTNVGSYKATITLKDTANCYWNDGSTSASKEIAYSITKGQATISALTAGWVYGKTPNVTATTNIGTIVFTYSTTENGTYTTTVPTNAGTYYVKATVEGTTNYDGDVDTISFLIEKATPTISGYDYSGEHYLNKLVFSTNGLVASHVTTSVTETPSGTFKFSDVTFAEGAGNSSITLTFTTTDANYVEKTEVNIKLSLKTVAKLNNSIPYPSIEKALEDAQKGDVVWVCPDASGELYIMDTVTIRSGVTLLLPYLTDSGEAGRNANSTATVQGASGAYASLATDELCATKVTLADHKTIINNGTIEIAGILSAGAGGANYSGQTAGSHGKLLLGENSKIDGQNGSKILCYGFIYEVEKNNGSSVVLNYGATLDQPFVLRDFRGGSYMAAVYYILTGSSGGIGGIFGGAGVKDFRYSPFSDYEFINVSSILKVEYGATMNAIVNLYAGDKYSNQTVEMIGSSENAVIQLTDLNNSYATAKYDLDTTVCDLHLYGGATTNGMKVSVSVGITVTVDTQESMFPVNYHFNITLSNNAENGQTDAVYNMNQNFKFMPGSSLTVDEGVTLDAGLLIFYDDKFEDQCPTTAYRYPVSEPAEFNLAGNLIAKELGAVINITSLNATITVTGSTFSQSHEVITISDSSINASVGSKQTITIETYIMYNGASVKVAEPGVYEVNKISWPKNGYGTVDLNNGVENVIVNGPIFDEYLNKLADSYNYATADVKYDKFFVLNGTEIIITLKSGYGFFKNDQLYANGTAIKMTYTFAELNSGSAPKGGTEETWIASSSDMIAIVRLPQVGSITIVSSDKFSVSESSITYNSSGTLAIHAKATVDTTTGSIISKPKDSNKIMAIADSNNLNSANVFVKGDQQSQTSGTLSKTRTFYSEATLYIIEDVDTIYLFVTTK